MSEIEANFTLKRTKEFIANVLEIDLDEIRGNLKSTARYIYEDVQKMLLELDHRYTKMSAMVISSFEGSAQADESSRTILGQYIQADAAPEYWLDTLNTKHSPFTSRPM
ncbi:hypothetical protein N5V81_13340 [Escherichia coli]|nr:hypothetical protein [Escherichia coli]